VSNKVLEFIIGAKDKTAAAATKAQAAFRKLGAAAKASFSTMLHYSKIALGGIMAISAGIIVAIKAAMNIDAAKNPFIRFTGSVKAAKQHIKELQDIGEQGVISTDQLIDASRELMNVSDGVLGTSKNMKILADAAATVGEDIGSLTDSYGKFYLKLLLGEPVKREVQELQRLGIITSETSRKMLELEKAGYSQDKIWRLLQNDIHKFAGGVEDDAKLAISSWGRLKETWKRDLEEIGGYFLDFAAEKLDAITAWLKKMREDGSLEKWAERAVTAFESAAKAAEKAIEYADKLIHPSELSPLEAAGAGAVAGGLIGGPKGALVGGAAGLGYGIANLPEHLGEVRPADSMEAVDLGIYSPRPKKTSTRIKPSSDVLKATREGFIALQKYREELPDIIGEINLKQRADERKAADERKKQQEDEIEQLEKKADSIEKSNSLLQDQARTAAELARKAADTAVSESERARELALSSKARKELKAQEKQTAKEEQRLAELAESALGKAEGQTPGSRLERSIEKRRSRFAERAGRGIFREGGARFQRNLSEEEQWALRHQQQKGIASEKMREAEKLDKDAKEAAKTSADRLTNIDLNITALKTELESRG